MHDHYYLLIISCYRSISIYFDFDLHIFWGVWFVFYSFFSC